jgi:D-alanyl-D-alanine carboxypeptidase
VKHRVGVAVVVALLAGSACSSDEPQSTVSTHVSTSVTAPVPVPSDASVDAIQDMLDAWTSKGPGGVTVGVGRDGGEVTWYASGAAGPDGEAIEVSDQLRVGSISKTFVAVMLLQIVDEGVLVLDEPVTRYAPDLTVAEGVTIRQLLGHASGIPEYTDESFDVEFLSDMGREWTPHEVLEHVADRPADFAPGERRAYSNTNYVVAGLLLEEVSGTSLADNLTSRIVEPLGLTDTYFAPEAGREPVAGFSPSLPGGDTTADSYQAIETAAGAAGALVSTAPDLADFISALADGQLLSPEMFSEMTRDVASEGFGLGIFPFGLPSGVGIGNGGAIPGFATLMGIVPEAGDLFVILTNDDSRSIDDLATEIISTWS